jgi:hypothetical protein
MKVSKTVKIVIFLLLMFITAYPTFLALATVQFLIWWFFTYGGRGGLEMESSGYYFLPITFLSAIVFFVSLVMLIKTIRSKNVEKLQQNQKN